jgi:predicted acetyltransferase
MVTIEIRVTRPDEYRSAAAAFMIALLQATPNDEAWERSLPSWEEMPSISAWEGDRCVGHAGQFLVDTTVPGGARLPTGAVSRVGVLPTHRRRSIATNLMETLIRDADERGLALMSLRASEATIYERYGFGVAGDYATMTLDPVKARPIRGAATAGSFRILSPDEIRPIVEPLYDRIAHRRPGVVTRTPSWWRRYLADAVEQSKASFVVVHADAEGVDDGYVHYDVAWSDGMDADSTGSGEVLDAFGADDSVELALWQYLCDIDLVTTWKATERPADDLVRQACRDTRAYSLRSIEDEQWLRLIDVEVALAARTFNAVDGRVAIQVTDPLLPGNDGTWEVSRDGARRTHDAPDLITDLATLSAAYLGGTTWWSLAATGRVDVRSPGAVEHADRLFAATPLPFCGSFF